MSDTYWGEWINGVRVEYRPGRRRSDKGDVIVGIQLAGDRPYTTFETYSIPWLHEIYHKELNRITAQNLKMEGT